MKIKTLDNPLFSKKKIEEKLSSSSITGGRIAANKSDDFLGYEDTARPSGTVTQYDIAVPKLKDIVDSTQAVDKPD